MGIHFGQLCWRSTRGHWRESEPRPPPCITPIQHSTKIYSGIINKKEYKNHKIVTPSSHPRAHARSSSGTRNISHHTLSFPIPVVPGAPAVVVTGGAGGMPVSVGDAFELDVASVVGANVLATVTLVESELGEDVDVVLLLVVDVDPLVVLFDVVASEARLEVAELGNEDDEPVVERVLEALDDNAVVSWAGVEVTEVDNEDDESVVEREGALEALDGSVVVSVTSDVGAGVAALDVPPVVPSVVGT